MSALPYNTAVRQYRKPALPKNAGPKPAWADLDLFCTPPWATRALIHNVLPKLGLYLNDTTVRDPCCGLGHMSDVLRETPAKFVFSSDIYLYGYGYKCDFLGEEIAAGAVDWTICNPPFKHSLGFALTALKHSRVGVALLVRSAWLEGKTRWKQLFDDNPPTVVAQFVERVAMVKGEWDPKAKSATAYCWVVWSNRHRAQVPRFMHIPPCRVAMSRPYDFDVFAGRRPPTTGGAL